MKTQTEAQRLADLLDGHDGALWVNDAASELRRLEAANAELLVTLEVAAAKLQLASDRGLSNFGFYSSDARAAIKKYGGT